MRSYTYDAYGNTESNGSFVNSFAYTGAVIDEETGLYYMNARYYDPATGRFISQDSYRGDGESFWHLYAYCDGDPVNYADPTGHTYKNYRNAIGFSFKFFKEGPTPRQEIINNTKLLKRCKNDLQVLWFKTDKIRYIGKLTKSTPFYIGNKLYHGIAEFKDGDLDWIYAEQNSRGKIFPVSLIIPDFTSAVVMKFIGIAVDGIMSALAKEKKLRFAGQYSQHRMCVYIPYEGTFIMHYHRDPGGMKNKNSWIGQEGPY